MVYAITYNLHMYLGSTELQKPGLTTNKYYMQTTGPKVGIC